MEMVKLMITYVEPHASKKNQKKPIWLAFLPRIIVLKSVSSDQEKR